jgi:hypothetical protein
MQPGRLMRVFNIKPRSSHVSPIVDPIARRLELAHFLFCPVASSLSRQLFPHELVSD